MIQRWKDVDRLALHGTDGEIGVLADALVDDRWVVRYLVVAPRSLQHQQVVISPIQVHGIDWQREIVEVGLSNAQVRQRPDVLSVVPMTRDTEQAYAAYYGFPAYWGGPDLWAWSGYPGALAEPAPASYHGPVAEAVAASLQSLKGLRGRHLAALDGAIGHVDDLFVDEETWRLDYLLVDTSNWIGGRHVLVPTGVVPSLDADGRDLVVDRTVARIREAPAYDASRPVDAALELAIAQHYGIELRPARRHASRAAGRTGGPPRP
jgi:hypothetical protein